MPVVLRAQPPYARRVCWAYSPEPRTEVYCVSLNFNISKMVYCAHCDVKAVYNFGRDMRLIIQLQPLAQLAFVTFEKHIRSVKSRFSD